MRKFWMDPWRIWNFGLNFRKIKINITPLRIFYIKYLCILYSTTDFGNWKLASSALEILKSCVLQLMPSFRLILIIIIDHDTRPVQWAHASQHHCLDSCPGPSHPSESSAMAQWGRTCQLYYWVAGAGAGPRINWQGSLHWPGTASRDHGLARLSADRALGALRVPCSCSLKS